MEDNRIIKNSIICLLGGTLFVLPLFGFAYDDKTTHPALTQEIVKFFNSKFQDLKISSEDAEYVIQGSIDEDAGIRALNHFYDPVYKRGLVLGKEWMSSKEWAQNTKAQAGLVDSALAGTMKPFFSGEDDYSWDRAIYEYTWGDKKRGLLTLGHILHLLEDATVPDHTRNDPHPPYLDTSPYESWTKKFDRDLINVQTPETPILLRSISEYFDKLANYSNNKFFSKDTTPDKNRDYQNPHIYKESLEYKNGEPFDFGYAVVDGEQYRLVRVKRGFADGQIQYSIDNKFVLSDYWSLLSKQAVLYGAGAVKLFFDEVEKEKQTKTLYEKNRSWVGKKLDKVKNLFSTVDNRGLASLIEAKPPEKTIEVSPPVGETSTTEVSPPKGGETSTSKTAEVEPLPQAQPEVRPQNEIPPLPPPPLPPPPPKSKDTSPDLPFLGVGGSPPAPQIQDTTPPDVTLNVNECNNSLSSSSCLVATTTINISWSSSAKDDLDYFELTVNGLTEKTGASSTIKVFSDNSTNTISVKAADHAGNKSESKSQTVYVATRPVVINEIAWAGTSATRDADEWIELYNPTDSALSLSGWVLRSSTDNSPYINLSGSISSKGFYLLERTDQNTISDITADQTYTGALVNDGEELELSKASTTIDKTPTVSACSGWCGGAASGQYYSMERYDPFSSGEGSSNWGSWPGFLANGKNADNAAINGTPGKRNSLNYLITKNGSSLSQDKTLKKSSSPYIISGGYTIAGGATLTVEPGVVIKFLTGQPSLTINGVLKAEGTSADKIVFTAFKDDDYGGDTNQDSTNTTPAAGDWASIKIAADGSVFDQTIVRYGGLEDGSGNHWANIRVETASSTIKNSVIEKSKTYGIWFKNSSGGTADGNTIRGNNRNVSGETPGTGIQVTNSSPTITNNQFTGNTKGLVIESGSAPSVSGNTFTQNTTSPIEVNASHPSFSSNTASGNGTNGVFLQGSISQDYTLSSNLPFVIQATYTVPAAKMLTIAAGTIIKLSGSGNITASGKINAAGTSGSKIIFTSLHDDDCGISGGCGDTNATTTSPAAGDWDNIVFNSGAASSTLQYVVVRYGGNNDNPLLNPPRGALRLISASVDIQNSTIEKNYIAGIFMQNSTSTVISNSAIREHSDSTSETFYGLYLTATSTPTISNTAFSGNETNIFTDSSSSYTNGGGNIGL